MSALDPGTGKEGMLPEPRGKLGTANLGPQEGGKGELFLSEPQHPRKQPGTRKDLDAVLLFMLSLCTRDRRGDLRSGLSAPDTLPAALSCHSYNLSTTYSPLHAYKEMGTKLHTKIYIQYIGELQHRYYTVFVYQPLTLEVGGVAMGQYVHLSRKTQILGIS